MNTIYKITYSELGTERWTTDIYETSEAAMLAHFTNAIKKHAYPCEQAEALEQVAYNLRKFAQQPAIDSGDSELIITCYQWKYMRDEGSFEVEFPTELTIYRTGEEVAA